MGSRSPHKKGQFWGKGSPIAKYRDILRWAVQKQLNRLICRLGCGLGYAEGSTSSIIFARWRHCAHMGEHIDATWRIWLNHPSAAAMRSYVKLLWPLSLFTFLLLFSTLLYIGFLLGGKYKICWNCKKLVARRAPRHFLQRPFSTTHSVTDVFILHHSRLWVNKTMESFGWV